MVRERDPSQTSPGQFVSPQRTDRAPLANISAKMQSPSPKNDSGETDGDAPTKPPTQAEFGKASPLRNPLRRPEPSLFMPKRQPLQKRTSPTHGLMSSAAQQAQAQGADMYVPAAQRGFYKPGQAPKSALPTQQPMPLAYQPHAHASDRDHHAILNPNNVPRPSVQPPPKPQFSSLGSNTSYQLFQAPRPMIDLTRDVDDSEDSFDPDAEIRSESGKFGTVDPYMYVDSSQANENIKNLLEGAFDDDQDKSRTRLRSRAKKAAKEGNVQEAKSLANKLAALNVKDADEEDAKPETEEEEEEEEEDGTVEGLVVKLLPHQVEGVSWMIDKEIGITKRKGLSPKGGILADDMGLGKTVQSVALLLTNARPEVGAKPEHPKQVLPAKEVGKGTLVVAPLALIKQWEEEIKTKVTRSHALRVLVHHGPNRSKSPVELKKYDVVITTYQTLTSEHAGSNMNVQGGARVGCFGVYWYRLILDEAHSIKNRNAKSTQACYALNSWYRWCLTGTPMQNNLDELQSLIKFLRIKPYSEVQNWKESITMPMKNGRGGLAMRRLQVFLRAFMKRRTKDILKKEGALNFGGAAPGAAKEGQEPKREGMQIVKREVFTMECDFDEQERQFYSRLQERADRQLKEMTKDGQRADYIGALVLLLRLRQACNHPQLIESAMDKDKDAMTTGSNSQASSQTRNKGASTGGDMDDLTAMMGGISVETRHCDVCQAELPSSRAKSGSVRCEDCDLDLLMMKNSKKKSKKDKSKEEAKVKNDQNAPVRRKQHRLPDDSDEEGDGEWIGTGPEQHVDLGKAGGTDDEDAEGGGDTLGSVDSDRSDDDDESVDDSLPRTHMRKRPVISNVSEEDDDEHNSDDDTDESVDDSADNEHRAPPMTRGYHSDSSKHKSSTKIRQLLRILHEETPEHKTIVFSQFTTMLDLIEPHLERCKIRYVRYDGSMRNDAREASLHSLRNDRKTRVLLCSLKCGSLGLNLTAASRVVIVEPFWNPFVEEQAIDRVHRLNQTVDVKVFRLTIRDTVEERIIALQERKRELAKAAIEGAGNDINKLSMKDILNLFQHNAPDTGEHDEQDREMWAKFGGDQRLLDGASAGISTARDDLGIMSSRQQKPGKARHVEEHSVYGRRW